MANNYNYSNNNNSNNYNYSNNNNSNNYNYSNNNNGNTSNNNLGNGTKGIKFDFDVADSNKYRHKITGFAYPEDKRVKTKITIDNTIVIRGCSIRFAKSDGHPFLTYPTFKNKKNEFVDLLFISDTTMSQAIVSGILGVC